MKLKKKLAAAAVSGMMLATCLSSAAPVVQTSLSAAAADDNNDDWLHAEGSKLYDANGNQVWLTGSASTARKTVHTVCTQLTLMHS